MKAKIRFIISNKMRHSSAVIGLIILMQLAFINNAAAAAPENSISNEIKLQLTAHITDIGLYYPNSVKRFYAATAFQPCWTESKANSKHTNDAMLLLDCVLQYGLAHNDYHPDKLTYSMLIEIAEHPDKVIARQKARFDLLLTDAMITLMNNLHYGKLNPFLSADKIDLSETGFRAEQQLSAALQQTDFMNAIESVQPKTKTYAALQNHMRLLEGVYKEDCYVTPEADVRKMAINMERLRWAAFDEDVYLQVNIPTYTLEFHQPDTTHFFKVIVGKPTTQTQTLNSAVINLTTYPETKIPHKVFVNEILPKALKDYAYLADNHFVIYDRAGIYVKSGKAGLLQVKRNPRLYYVCQWLWCDELPGKIVFRFPNAYNISLDDTNEPQLFGYTERALSNRCVRVENAERLAELLLKYKKDDDKIAILNKALTGHKTKNIFLKNKVPIKITYLTCEVKEGLLVTHPDVYNLDKSLEMALYNTTETLTNK